ncbi:MAG: alpha/beta hydrolase [Afipia sp.]|nr:alpha/beta hydrolase [Afipia sp.]
MRAARAQIAKSSPPDVRVEWLTIKNGTHPLRIRIFRPKRSGTVPGILYCHGGGWMYGSPEQSEELAYLYVKEVGAVVVSPEYRLSPEYPFPYGFDDCYAALTWMGAHGDSIGIDPMKIAVAGESSGGNLAAACALAARDRAGPKIVQQFLNYPALGINFETSSYRENADAPILSRPEMEYFWRAYLSGDLGCQDPFAVPLAAENLAGLPPAHIVVAEYDPLRDDGIAYADRLREAGSVATLRHAKRLPHGFFRGMSVSLDVQAMAEALCEALRSGFNGMETKSRRQSWT